MALTSEQESRLQQLLTFLSDAELIELENNQIKYRAWLQKNASYILDGVEAGVDTGIVSDLWDATKDVLKDVLDSLG